MIDEMYITMCREAVEIQEGWEPKLGDLSWDYFIFPKGQLRVLEEYEDSLNAKRHEDNFWLPRQEDLQEIYAENHSFTTWGIIEEFYKFFKSKCAVCNVSNRLNANENLNVVWLCFVMETCYGKRWNGETWEAI